MNLVNLTTATTHPVRVSRRMDEMKNCRKLSNSRLDIKALGIDIGGTLTKLVLFGTDDCENRFKNLNLKFSNISKAKIGNYEGTLTSTEFPSHQLETLNKVLASCHSASHRICTGGGSFKYRREIEAILGNDFNIKPELDCLAKGLLYALKNSIADCSGYDLNLYKIPVKEEIEYPYLIANLGSGVSIVKVENEMTTTRVSETSTGGSTFMGLCQLLTNCDDFHEALRMTEKGDNSSVDLFVKDIYGDSCKELNLNGNLIAASFGKVNKNASKEDLARATLMMITIDIELLTAECAVREKIQKVFFTGNFLKDNELGRKMLHSVVKYRSQNINPTFLNHQGYLGALGALLFHALDS